MKLTNKNIHQISDLIKIKLDENEVQVIAAQINSVIEAVEVLKELDTSDTSETSQTHGLENIMRNDENVSEGLDMSVYPNTKNFKNGYFIVRKK